MNIATIFEDRVTLYSWVDRETLERVHVQARLPRKEYDGERIYLIDWKIDGESVKITYQMRNDAYAPIFDAVLPVCNERFPLQKPRGRNWKIDQYQDYWRNEKTGKKSYF